ncbi:MAG TPA: TonB-dependent receptor [Chitinophagaceae bacterium]|nr:TonB-dependent receptor [Chitinophagaceae bacterium]
MSICMMAGIATAQSGRTVTGVVKDVNGKPVADASVVVKGTTIGTTTDSKGMFTLTSVPASAKILVVSSINFETTDVSIGNGVVSVTLKASEDDLGEVVVTVPYGTVKRTAFTGSSNTVSASTINKQQVTSVSRVLEGLIPGLQATNGGGAPGSGAAVRLRGIGSVNASSSPLYVVNGVPYDGSISAIASEDIESFDVLKDAAAANLYGSRAANGVIMITTKRGKGAPSLQGSIRHSFSSRGIPEYDRVGAADYYELFWEAYRNSYVYGSGQTMAQAGVNASNILTGSSGLVYNAYNVPGNTLVDPVTGKLNPNAQLLWNESWSDALFRTAQRTNANVSISGSSDKANYYISGGYLNEEGAAKFSGYKRYTFRASVDIKATKYLKAGINIDGASDRRDGLFAGGTATSNPFYYSRQMGPIYPVYERNLTTGAIVKDANGNPVLDFGTTAQMGSRPYAANSNLVGTLALDKRQQKRLNGNFNPYIEISFLKDFTFRTQMGLNYYAIDALTYQNNQYGDAANVQGRSTVSNDYQFSLTGNQVIKWAKNFKKHNVSALAGHENYKYKSRSMSATKTGFSYPGQTELDNGTVVESPPSSSEDLQTMESYFGGVNYSYDDKYLASASIRTDGSSRFASDVRWGSFYSFGLGWRISQESFLKNVNWIDEMKIKLSYGESGNENIGYFYQYKDWYYADGLGNFAPPTRLANKDLKWEKNRALNYGVEFTMFKRRLQGSIELYDRRSSDLIFGRPIEPSVGAGNDVLENVGQVKNTGIEIQLGYNVVRKKNFDWRVDFNISSFKNVITELPKAQREKGIISGTKKMMEGKSVYDFWLREFAGVSAATGRALYYRDVLDNNGKPTGNRVITDDATLASFYYVGGSAIPKFMGGITNSFRYKNFDFSFLMTYSYGGRFYDGNYASIMHYGSAGTALHVDAKNRWQKPGDITNVPRLQNASGQETSSSRFLLDASYLSIKNVTLSYSLSNNVAKKIHLNGASFFVNVDNAYIFTAKKGSDPQQSFDGVTGAGYPPFRTFTLGATIKL